MKIYTQVTIAYENFIIGEERLKVTHSCPQAYEKLFTITWYQENTLKQHFTLLRMSYIK